VAIAHWANVCFDYMSTGVVSWYRLIAFAIPLTRFSSLSGVMVVGQASRWHIVKLAIEMSVVTSGAVVCK
jgi:hypothetical protein